MTTATQTYKAYELTAFGFDSIKAAQRDVPKLGSNDVLVRIKAVSLNYRDIMVSTGKYSPNMKFPLIPLSDAACEVEAVGDQVTRFKKGDRVAPNFMTNWISGQMTADAVRSALGGAVDGVLRQAAVFNEQSLVRLPSHLSFEEAATLPCAALTAWNGLINQGGLKPGQTVLVLGSGGVSVFALQFAVMSGARVIATSSSNDKLKKLIDLGATHGINYKETPNWDLKVIELTEGVGVDHVVEVGGSGTLERSLNAVRLGGHVSLIGVLSGLGQMNPITVLMKNIKLYGIYVGSRMAFEEMNTAVSMHKLKPVIDKVFEADQIEEALNYMQSGAHFGKVVLKMK